jgi:hypothetical protein
MFISVAERLIQSADFGQLTSRVRVAYDLSSAHALRWVPAHEHLGQMFYNPNVHGAAKRLILRNDFGQLANRILLLTISVRCIHYYGTGT